MKTNIFHFLLPVLLLVTTINVFSQTDAPLNQVEVTTGTPHPSERNLDQTVIETPSYVQQWGIDLQKARWAGDNATANELSRKIDEFYGVIENDFSKVPLDRPIATQVLNSPEQSLGDWYSSDVSVYTGGLRYDGYRQLALINGDDNNLYTIINTSITNSTTRLYRSTNHGVTWSNIGSVTYGANYAQSVNIAFADSNAINRIACFISYGSQTMPTRNGSIWFISWRTDGSMAQVVLVQNPPASQGFREPSIITDGFYYPASTTWFFGAYVAVNSAGVTQGVYTARTTNFGATWTTYAPITTGYDDQYPFIEYKQIIGGAESLYVATSRVFSTTSAGIRLERQSISNMGTAWTTTFLTSGGNYRKPSFSIRHTNTNATNNQMLITCTNNDNGVYHYSVNAGASFLLDYILAQGTENPVSFTNCTLDSQTVGNNYAKAVFIANGDSVIYRGGVLGSLGARIKVNSNLNSGLVVPAVSSYRTGANVCGAVVYAGSGPTNVYFDGECLITGINPVAGETPTVYSLNQNYPNPFNPSTNIKFSIPQAGLVKISVYDITGRLVSTLVNEQKTAGIYNVDFNASMLSSGIYFYKLEAGSFVETKKMMLIK